MIPLFDIYTLANYIYLDLLLSSPVIFSTKEEVSSGFSKRLGMPLVTPIGSCSDGSLMTYHHIGGGDLE